MLYYSTNLRLILLYLFACSDYKAEYIKLREAKLTEEAKMKENKLAAIAKSKGEGSEVHLGGFVEEVNNK